MAVDAVMGHVTSGSRALSNAVVTAASAENKIRVERPNLYRSFLLTRLLVGIVGVALPTLIIAWDLGSDLMAGRPAGLRGSLSAYYYHTSPLGDWFVGCLWAIGVGLMVYMGIRKNNFANITSWVAGTAAIAVAMFPTNDDGTPSLWTSNLHFISAGILIVGLGILCVGFGVDDYHNLGDRSKHWLHGGAALAIFLSVVFVVINTVHPIWASHGVLAAELVAVYAFAISWFVKGAELRTFGREHPTDASEGLMPLPDVSDDRQLAAR